MRHVEYSAKADPGQSRLCGVIRDYSATIFVAILVVFISAVGLEARAQSEPNSIALKSGETVVLGPLWYVSKCRSIMIGLPEVEILDGPPEIKLNLKVLPRRLNCPNTVPGAILSATASEVKEASQAKLTFRVKYKTRDGDRQVARIYNVSLFP